MSKLSLLFQVIAHVFVVLLLPTTVLSQPNNLGYAPYGMLSDHWDCGAQQKADAELSELRIAILWNTFGTNTACLKTYLADPRLKAIEIHLINEVCQRRGSCGSYEFLFGTDSATYNRDLKNKDPVLLTRIKSYFKEPANFLAAHLKAGTTCYISPGLESNLDTAAAKVLLQQASEVFPNCKIVWNPVNNSRAAKPISGAVFEQHGPGAVLSLPCIANLDGVDLSYPSRSAILPQNFPSTDLPLVANRFRSCDINFLWIAEYNGIKSKTSPDPRQRRLFPDQATFELVSGSIKMLQSLFGPV